MWRRVEAGVHGEEGPGCESRHNNQFSSLSECLSWLHSSWRLLKPITSNTNAEILEHIHKRVGCTRWCTNCLTAVTGKTAGIPSGCLGPTGCTSINMKMTLPASVHKQSPCLYLIYFQDIIAIIIDRPQHFSSLRENEVYSRFTRWSKEDVLSQQVTFFSMWWLRDLVSFVL